MKRASPVLLLGLGEAGSDSVVTIYERLIRGKKELVPLVTCVLLRNDGVLTDYADKATLPLAGLTPKVTDETFAANYSATFKGSSAIAPWLAERLARLLRQDARMPLQEAGYLVDTAIKVLLVSEIADPIGSAALIPFLAILQELQAGRLRGALFEVAIMGFLPDVFPESRNSEQAFGRAYTCLQELEYVAENPSITGVENNAAFNNVFLFSARNEDSVEIASAGELLVMAGELLSGLWSGEIASDASYSLALTRQVEGKTTRYSSFGLSKLIFPVDEVMRAIATHYELAYLTKSIGNAAPSFNSDLVSADVKEFVGRTQLDQLPTLMRTNDAGTTLYSEFKYSGSVSEKVNVDTFLTSLDEESAEFERTTGTAMSRGLAIRREGLLAKHADNLESHIKLAMDDSEKGPYYAKAFTDVLRDSPSEYVKDDGAAEHYSLTVVEANAKRFFDSLFGIDRASLSRLRRDLADKKALLAERQATVDKAKTPGPASSDSLEPVNESLVDTLPVLKKEIEQLETECSTRADKIDQFDLKLADAADRRNMLEQLRGDEAAERSKKQGKLKATDSELRSAVEALDDLYLERRRIAFKLVVVYPLGIAVALAAVEAGRVKLMGVSLPEAIQSGLNVLPVLLGLYAVGAAISYFVGIHARVRQAELAVELKKGEKRRALLDLQQSYTQRFHTSFEHELFSGLIGWIAQYKSKAAEISKRIEEFLSELTKTVNGLREALEKTTFPNSPLVRSAVGKEDVQTIIAENMEAPHEEETFRRRNPVSTFFEGFRQDGDLRRLSVSVNMFTEQVFAKIRTQSIETVLARTLGPAGKLTSRLSQLYQASKAFIQLDVEKGSDVSQALVYVGTQTDESSTCREILGRVSDTSTTFFATGNQYELTAMRLKVGFPAFHVALVSYGRKIVSQGDPRRFAVDPEWDLIDLVPSLFVAGNADDAARNLFCLGRAFDLITYDKKNGYVIDETRLGSSLEECLAELRKPGNGTLRGQLTYKIAAGKGSADALERLNKFKAVSRRDSVDLAILDRTIAEISPLA